MNNRRLRISGFILATMVFAIAVNVQAQSSHLSARNMALGGGGTAYMEGYHANFTNPGNLLLGDGSPRLTMGLLGGISSSAGGSLLNVSVYNEYFTQGLIISDQVAVDALGAWFGNGSGTYRDAGMQLDVIPLGLSYRGKGWAASLALRSRVLVDGSMTRGLAELGVYGLDGEVFTDPTPVNAGFEVLAFHEVSAGFALQVMEIPSLFGFAENIKVYAGGAPKLLLGTHTSRLDFNSTLQIEGESENQFDLIRHDFRYSFETTGSLSEQLQEFYEARQSQGTVPDIGDYVDPVAEDFYEIKAGGFGLDLGVTAEMDLNLPLAGGLFEGPEKLRVGLSLTDLGTIKFDDRAERFAADDLLEWQGFTLDDEVIENEFDGDRGEYLESVLVDSIGTEVYGSFAPEGSGTLKRPLPSRLNLGGQLVMNRLSVALDFGRGFHTQGVNSRQVSMSTGVEYRLFGFLPLRAGMQTGGGTSTNYSGGIGLEFRNFEFSFAASTARKGARKGSYGAGAWSGLVFKF